MVPKGRLRLNVTNKRIGQLGRAGRKLNCVNPVTAVKTDPWAVTL